MNGTIISTPAVCLSGGKGKTLHFPSLLENKVIILTPSEEHITKKY